MKTKVLHADLPQHKRLMMVSDLHGHATGLKQLLEDAGFSGDDVLVIVGDIVEKGPENLKALRYVLELSQQSNVYVLMGNVDLWRIERLLSDDPEKQHELLEYSLGVMKWWPSTFLGEMCEEIGVNLSSDMDTQKIFPLLREHFRQEVDFLLSLPTILETQDMIFVHGGIPHERLSELADTDCHRYLKWDHFLQDGLSFSKYVVVGHWPTALYFKDYPRMLPVIDRDRKIISLDGGCGIKEFGQLNLLLLNNGLCGEWEIKTWDPLPEIVALESQEESGDSLFIQWGDNRVEVLNNDGDWAEVLYHDSQIRVLSEFLYEHGGVMYCDDYTTYELSVQKGDILRLCRARPNVCLVKKDGIVGWYRGRYRKR